MEELEKVVFDAAIVRVKKLSFGVFEVFVSFEVDPLVGRDVLRCHPKLWGSERCEKKWGERGGRGGETVFGRKGWG